MLRKRIFVSHVVPKKLIEKLEVSPAGNYFSYNLIDYGVFDQVISLVPTNIIDIIGDSKDNVEFLQSRTFGNKGFMKLINVFVENIKLFRKIRKNSDVWFYNLTHHSLLAFLLLKFLKKDIKVFIIVLDFTPAFNFISLQNLILKLINSTANGVITLKDINEITNKNKLTLPGIVNEIETQQIAYPNKKFLLSGILSSNRNPKLIYDVFSKFPEFELIITGKVEDKVLLNKYTSTCSNITFLGLLEYKEYQNILNSVTYCINSRDPKFEENNFNFPSKVIEHLLYNKVVISTMKYYELDGINYFFIESSEDELTKFLNNLKSLPAELILQYANQSKLILQKFGVDKWKNSFKKIENYNNL